MEPVVPDFNQNCRETPIGPDDLHDPRRGVVLKSVTVQMRSFITITPQGSRIGGHRRRCPSVMGQSALEGLSPRVIDPAIRDFIATSPRAAQLRVQRRLPSIRSSSWIPE